MFCRKCAKKLPEGNIWKNASLTAPGSRSGQQITVTVDMIYAAWQQSEAYKRLNGSKKTHYRTAWQGMCPTWNLIFAEMRLLTMQRVVDECPGGYYPKWDIRILYNHRQSSRQSWAKPTTRLPSAIPISQLPARSRRSTGCCRARRRRIKIDPAKAPRARYSGSLAFLLHHCPYKQASL